MLNEFDKNKSFLDHIKNYISDELYYLEGDYCYGYDLAQMITENDNVNGAIYVSTADNKDFIKEYWDAASVTYEYAKDEFGVNLNPFRDPERFVFFMYDMGIKETLNQSNFIQEHWNDEFKLDKNNINLIKKELGLEYDKTKIKTDAEEM